MKSFVIFWGLVVRDLLQFRNKGGKKRIFYDFVACVLCIYLYGGWGKNLSTV